MSISSIPSAATVPPVSTTQVQPQQANNAQATTHTHGTRGHHHRSGGASSASATSSATSATAPSTTATSTTTNPNSSTGSIINTTA